MISCSTSSNNNCLLFADAPDREAEFESKSAAFEHQANQVADTASKLANAGGNTNKRLLDQIRQNAEEVSIIDRFASFGAFIVLLLQYYLILLQPSKRNYCIIID